MSGRSYQQFNLIVMLISRKCVAVFLLRVGLDLFVRVFLLIFYNPLKHDQNKSLFFHHKVSLLYWNVAGAGWETTFLQTTGLFLLLCCICLFFFLFIVVLDAIYQGPMKVITVRDTPPYGHAPTYQISLTYLERQNSYGPDKLRWEEAEEKIRLKQYVSLRSKGRHNYGRGIKTHQNWKIVFSCSDHKVFVFRDRSMIIGMWVHDHKAVCRVP
jgi:hypothetical protein